MIAIGLDIGGRNVRGVALKEGRVTARAALTSGFEPEARALEVYKELAKTADARPEAIAATGMGREAAAMAKWRVTEVSALARACGHLFPGVGLAVEVGAEESRAVALSPEGRVMDSAVNDRCAAGSGAFVESMARALNMEMDTLGEIGCRGGGEVKIDTQCVVFAESEVISLVHRNIPPGDIARAVYDSIANRASVMARRMGTGGEAALFGGMTLSRCFVELLKGHLGVDTLHVPDHPDYAGALGAALIAADRAGGADG